MSLQPRTYAEAKAKRDGRPQRQRTPIKRGNSQMKRTRMKVRKVSKVPTVDGASERSIRDECDRLTREIVLRNERQCFIPNCQRTDLQCGHLFERRHQVTRYDTFPSGNNHAQCSYHNALHEELPWIYRRAFIEKRGPEAYALLVARKDLPVKRTYIELLAIRDELKAKREAML